MSDQIKQAKKTLVTWLREKAKLAGHDNYVEWGNLSWRVNRPEPYYGIYDNYPITTDFPSNVDECVDDPWGSVKGLSYVDIAISHKGNIHSVIFIDLRPNLKYIRETSVLFCSSYEVLMCSRIPNAFPGSSTHSSTFDGKSVVIG